MYEPEDLPVAEEATAPYEAPEVHVIEHGLISVNPGVIGSGPR